MRVNSTRAPTRTRGCIFKVVYRNGCGYTWWYEKASDVKFYFQKASCLTHGPNCLNKDATAAQNLARGDFHIPEKLALNVASGCPGTSAINDMLVACAAEDNRDLASPRQSLGEGFCGRTRVRRRWVDGLADRAEIRPQVAIFSRHGHTRMSNAHILRGGRSEIALGSVSWRGALNVV
jgi:hypothetical protein